MVPTPAVIIRRPAYRLGSQCRQQPSPPTSKSFGKYSISLTSVVRSKIRFLSVSDRWDHEVDQASLKDGLNQSDNWGSNNKESSVVMKKPRKLEAILLRDRRVSCHTLWVNNSATIAQYRQEAESFPIYSRSRDNYLNPPAHGNRQLILRSSHIFIHFQPVWNDESCRDTAPGILDSGY